MWSSPISMCCSVLAQPGAEDAASNEHFGPSSTQAVESTLLTLRNGALIVMVVPQSRRKLFGARVDLLGGDQPSVPDEAFQCS